MNTAKLLTEVQRRGIELRAEGASLHYRAPKGTLTADLRAKLKAHKAELLDILGKPSNVIPFPRYKVCGPAMLKRDGCEGHKWSDYCPSEKVRVAKMIHDAKETSE